MKNNLFSLSIILLVGIFLIGITSAANESATSFCCEKTNSGAWCQNAPESECSSAYQKTPSSCEATSFCKMGCCYNSQEGNCVENSPQKVCEEENGVWADSANCEIGQCNLGCCLIGDQAAFVTQTRCKRLGNLYGLNIDFRTDIGNEFDCIASITSDVKGACVYEKEFQTECSFISKKDCSVLGESNTSFYQGRLCSDEKLGTTCAPTEKTTCVEGKDEVYFVDSCGNLANVYDSSKVSDKDYWAKVYDVSESCGFGKSNANSASCGNCDYYFGSTCKAYKRGEDRSAPLIGDNLCKDLSCEYLGKTYKHGESWCDSQGGTDKNLPGSRYFRLMCYNREVMVEPCADFRQETCIQDEVNGFKSAACRVNRWQDCFLQTEKEDCENQDRRDCSWLSGVSAKVNSSIKENVCVPEFAPGFDFWNTQGDASKICASATSECVVEYEVGLLGSKECVKNCECLDKTWETSMAKMCTSLGDCGNKVNFVGQAGYKQKEYIKITEVKEEETKK